MRKNERGLSMNRAPSPRPSPPLGERVSEGRVRGISTGSWSLCMRKNESVLSVGRQVLDCASPLALFDWVSGRKSGRGLPHSKTLSLRRTHLRGSRSNACRKTNERLFIRQVLDCASPLALFDRVSGRKSGRGLPQSMMLSRRRTHLRDSQSNACRKTKEGLFIRQVLDCASPLALFDRVSGRKSGRGLPHSKTLSLRRTHLRDSPSNACRKTKEGLFIRQVLDCASPLALFDWVSGRKSGRGL